MSRFSGALLSAAPPPMRTCKLRLSTRSQDDRSRNPRPARCSARDPGASAPGNPQQAHSTRHPPHTSLKEFNLARCIFVKQMPLSEYYYLENAFWYKGNSGHHSSIRFKKMAKPPASGPDPPLGFWISSGALSRPQMRALNSYLRVVKFLSRRRPRSSTPPNLGLCWVSGTRRHPLDRSVPHRRPLLAPQSHPRKVAKLS